MNYDHYRHISLPTYTTQMCGDEKHVQCEKKIIKTFLNCKVRNSPAINKSIHLRNDLYIYNSGRSRQLQFLFTSRELNKKAEWIVGNVVLLLSCVSLEGVDRMISFPPTTMNAVSVIFMDIAFLFFSFKGSVFVFDVYLYLFVL